VRHLDDQKVVTAGNVAAGTRRVTPVGAEYVVPSLRDILHAMDLFRNDEDGSARLEYLTLPIRMALASMARSAVVTEPVAFAKAANSA
jgi:hypothetical protein